MNAPDTESRMYKLNRRQKAAREKERSRGEAAREAGGFCRAERTGKQRVIHCAFFTVYLHLHCPYPLAWVYKLVGSSAFSSFSAITTSTTIAAAAVGSQVTTVRLPLQRNDMISCILRTANGLRPYRTRQSKARKCSSYRLY